MRMVMLESLEAHQLDIAPGTHSEVLSAPALQFQSETDVIKHRPPRHQREILKHDCAIAAWTRDRFSADHDASAGGLHQAGDGQQQAAFPAAAGTHYRDERSARDIQADVLFDEIHQIADTPQKGTKTVRRGEGDNSTVETTEADMIEHRRLQIDARKWLIGKMAPKKYGDKQTHEHAGPGGGPVTLEALLMARIKKKE